MVFAAVSGTESTGSRFEIVFCYVKTEPIPLQSLSVDFLSVSDADNKDKQTRFFQTVYYAVISDTQPVVITVIALKFFDVIDKDIRIFG